MCNCKEESRQTVCVDSDCQDSSETSMSEIYHMHKYYQSTAVLYQRKTVQHKKAIYYMAFSQCLIEHTVPGTPCIAAGAPCEMSSVCLYTHLCKYIFIYLYYFPSFQMKDQMHNAHIDTNSQVSEEKISEANHFICSGELAKLL